MYGNSFEIEFAENGKEALYDYWLMITEIDYTLFRGLYREPTTTMNIMVIALTWFSFLGLGNKLFFTSSNSYSDNKPLFKTRISMNTNSYEMIQLLSKTLSPQTFWTHRLKFKQAYFPLKWCQELPSTQFSDDH